MLRNDLQSLISRAVAAQVSAGTLPAVLADFRPEISDTKQPEHGDFACNLAMVASKAAGMNPRQLGEALRTAILETDGGNTLDDVEVAGPGFLNLRLKPTAIAAYVPTALELGTEKLAQVPQPKGKKINVEFVSVNPNGPITIGSGRGAAFGSALCNVLAAAGNEVHREYYINDGVNSEQMRLFAESVAALLRGEPVPDNGYKGDYVQKVANRVAKELSGNSNESTRTALFKVISFFNKITDWDLPDNPDPELLVSFVLKPTDAQITRSAVRIKVQHLATEYFNWKYGTAYEKFGLDFTDPNSVLRAYIFAIFTVTKSIHGNLVLPTFYKAHWLELQDNAFNEADDLPTAMEKVKQQVLNNKRTQSLEMNIVITLVALFGAIDVSLSRAAQDFLVTLFPQKFATDLGWNTQRVREYSQRAMLQAQEQDLATFGVTFDTWFSEQSLHDSGVVAQRLDELTAKGVADDQPFRTKVKIVKGKIEETEIEPQETVKDEDDAEGSGKTLWLRSTKFGDDQDRVLRRRDGRLTYISSDVAYHADKFNRPAIADKLITVLGPDHHGYIGRLNAVVAALLQTTDQTDEQATATAREKLEVVIFQVVRFLKEGKPAPMRKRDGNIYALIDLINEIGQSTAPNADAEEQQRIGRDVTRFFYLMRSHDTAMDFDLDLAARQSDENPVFYAQYAHARICSVLARAGEIEPGAADHALLVHPREGLLIKKILDLPWEVERSARDYGVHRLTTYVVELARLFHHFYDACRVVQPEQPELSRARLDLCRLTKNALQAALDLLGISAPERMERAALASED